MPKYTVSSRNPWFDRNADDENSENQPKDPAIHGIRHYATKSEYGILLRLHREFHIPLSTLFSCDPSGSA
jgi:hypothetical protein